METKILLIDDDVLVHFINKKLLQGEYPEKDSHFFNSASLALEYLKANRDIENIRYVIFLDINMPEINGWEFMDLLKENFSHLNFEIHMLTSSVEEDDQKMAEDYEYVCSYIFKPLNKSKLLEVLDLIPRNTSQVK